MQKMLPTFGRIQWGLQFIAISIVFAPRFMFNFKASTLNVNATSNSKPEKGASQSSFDGGWPAALWLVQVWVWECAVGVGCFCGPISMREINWFGCGHIEQGADLSKLCGF